MGHKADKITQTSVVGKCCSLAQETKFIFAAGGTGGHIFPAVGVYQYIKKTSPQTEIIFVISERTVDKRILDKYGCHYEILSAKPLPRSLREIPNFVAGFFKSLIQSFKIVGRYKPNLVVGFGCYISAPVALAAFFNGKKVVLHEQNVLPSKTNLFLKRFAKTIFLSFEETKQFFPKNNTFVVGNPLRDDLRVLDKTEASGRLKMRMGNFNILVMGGSQGAKKLNEVVPAAVGLLGESERQRVSIIHLSGGNAEAIQKVYSEVNVEALARDFLDEMELAFSISDLAITRAGALTLSELAFFCMPAVIVPYVYDKGFQLGNAEHFAKSGAVLLLEEKDFTSAKLKETIEKFMREPQVMSAMKEKMALLRKPSAAKEIVEILLFKRMLKCRTY